MDTEVFVIGLTGIALMPTTPRKARILLKDGKAKVFCKRPFTIQLLYKTGSTIQPLSIGVDTGSQHPAVGICTIENGVATAIYSTEIELRSSMEKRKLIEKRKEYRRGRRYRKVRYRHPKFRFRTKRIYSAKKVKRKSTKKMTHWIKVPPTIDTRPKGWLPPSIQSKVDHHIEWINRYLAVLPEGTKLTIEAARFDMARMKDPNIHGDLYQRGPQYDAENTKAYVFARDGYKCKCCNARGGTIRKADGSRVKLIAHHLLLKAEGATDNPEYLVTVCDACHTPRNHKPGGILYQWYTENKKFKRGLRDATAMNILANCLRKAFPQAAFTYGNITAADRKRFLLPKGHAEDAVCIAAKDAKSLVCRCSVTCYKQARSKKRSLHEANPRKGDKEPNREAKRNSKNTRRSNGFSLFDRVLLGEQRGWIKGFTGYGSGAYVVDAEGNYIGDGNKIRHQLSALRITKKNNNWIQWNGRTMCALSSPI